MISFFRKIRKSLLNEGRTSRYFKYAIGEILLVVIGILIALQINNWNENNKLSQLEKYLINHLKNDFLSDKKQLESFARLTEGKYEAGLNVVEMIKDYSLNPESIAEYDLVIKLFLDGKLVLFNSFTPTYDEIVSSGQLSVLKNDELKSQIKAYKNFLYTLQSFIYAEAQLRKQKYNSHLYKYYNANLVNKIFGYARKKNKSEKDLQDFINEINILGADTKGFINDPESKYHINNVISIDKELSFFYKNNILKKINEILNTLDNEINKNN